MSAEQTTIYRQLLSFLDLTSLESTDTRETIQTLCAKARSFGDRGLPHPAAVCVFSPFIQTARESLNGTSIKIATVACGFPHGQIPESAKESEVRFALDAGVQEVDIVFPRGWLLDKKPETLHDHVIKVREWTQSIHLKVILETGELKDPGLIAEASQIAMDAGADFIKTSTGKGKIGATPESVDIMTREIQVYWKNSGRKVGIKPAGGISTPEDAQRYYEIVATNLGKDWLKPSLFRIGASRLADRLIEKLPYICS
jgi:deoxyribose-phosphate aldolase